MPSHPKSGHCSINKYIFGNSSYFHLLLFCSIYFSSFQCLPKVLIVQKKNVLFIGQNLNNFFNNQNILYFCYWFTPSRKPFTQVLNEWLCSQGVSVTNLQNNLSSKNLPLRASPPKTIYNYFSIQREKLLPIYKAFQNKKCQIFRFQCMHQIYVTHQANLFSYKMNINFKRLCYQRNYKTILVFSTQYVTNLKPTI
eukprot:TRINITY_DN11866_c0_g1_i2.p1 TRINITY_DN11866_c0_g1~~TRINITY_DN11866_c0_g1_i2.p1  ORF type:complete len:196 (-),score=-20.77 TRINITY_DN11866_c0_g1_i2:280-867(-)